MTNSRFIDFSLLVNKINHLHYLIFIKAVNIENLVLNEAKSTFDVLSEDFKQVCFKDAHELGCELSSHYFREHTFTREPLFKDFLNYSL